MPPRRYAVMHGDARSSDDERRELMAALQAMEAAGDDGEGGRRNRGRDRGGDDPAGS